MKREPDLDALAEALEQVERPSWLARLARHALAKTTGPALFAVAAVVLMARTGVDLGRVLAVMFYGTPLIVAGVVVFVVHAWRQNQGLTYVAPAGQVDLAEPGQPDQLGQPEVTSPASHLDRPAPPVTVTATVRDLPKAEPPRAVGQAVPLHTWTGAAHEAEEDTDA